MTHTFLWDLTAGLIEKKIPLITQAVLKFAQQALHHNPPGQTTCYSTLNFATGCKNCFNLVGGLFQCQDDAIVECVSCRKPIYVNVEISIMQFNLYSAIPLEEFIVPRLGQIWTGENLFLRCMKAELKKCPTCDGAFFKWMTVPFEPKIAGYPLTLFIQRHRPVVEPVHHPSGPVPIPQYLTIGEKGYHYCGWTAKMGEMSMVPFLKVNDNKNMRYCFTPGGIVQFISDRKHEVPKDPRHVDMLIYRTSF